MKKHLLLWSIFLTLISAKTLPISSPQDLVDILKQVQSNTHFNFASSSPKSVMPYQQQSVKSGSESDYEYTKYDDTLDTETKGDEEDMLIEMVPPFVQNNTENTSQDIYNDSPADNNKSVIGSSDKPKANANNNASNLVSDDSENENLLTIDGEELRFNPDSKDSSATFYLISKNGTSPQVTIYLDENGNPHIRCENSYWSHTPSNETNSTQAGQHSPNTNTNLAPPPPPMPAGGIQSIHSTNTNLAPPAPPAPPARPMPAAAKKIKSPKKRPMDLLSAIRGGTKLKKPNKKRTPSKKAQENKSKKKTQNSFLKELQAGRKLKSSKRNRTPSKKAQEYKAKKKTQSNFLKEFKNRKKLKKTPKNTRRIPNKQTSQQNITTERRLAMGFESQNESDGDGWSTDEDS